MTIMMKRRPKTRAQIWGTWWWTHSSGHQSRHSPFRVPKLQWAGECHKARVAGIHEECMLNRDQTTRSAMAGHVMLITVVSWAPRSGTSLAGLFPVPPGASPVGGLQCGQQWRGLGTVIHGAETEQLQFGSWEGALSKEKFRIVKSALEIGNQKNALLNLLPG